MSELLILRKRLLILTLGITLLLFTTFMGWFTWETLSIPFALRIIMITIFTIIDIVFSLLVVIGITASKEKLETHRILFFHKK